MSNFFGNIEVSTEFEAGGGSFEPMPSGTKSKAIIEEAKWDNFEDNYYINIRWSLLGGEFNNRKVFQKIKVREDDKKKAEKALRMLAAIDANAGGKLMAAGTEPSDDDLAIALVNKSMMITLDVWEINDKKGNWVRAVAASGSGQSAPPPKAAVSSTDDSIPF
jgi:hypothetical protein